MEAANVNEIWSIYRLSPPPNQSRGAGGDHQVRVGSHRSSVGDVPRGMRWHPCVTRASARRWGLPAPRAGGKREREYGERSRKRPQIEREAK
jgi:hypothetical protein